MFIRTLALWLKNLDFHCLLNNVTYHVIYGDDNHHHSIQIHLRSFICGHKIDWSFMSVHHRSTDSNIKSSHGNDISPRKRHIKLSNWSQLNASWFASTRIKSSWYYITTFVLVVEENSKWYKKVSEWDYGAKFASSRLEDWDPTEIFAHSCKRFTNSLSRGETSGCGISIVTDAFFPIHYF